MSQAAEQRATGERRRRRRRPPPPGSWPAPFAPSADADIEPRRPIPAAEALVATLARVREGLQ